MKGNDVPVWLFEEFSKEFSDEKGGRVICDASYGDRMCRAMILPEGMGALGVWQSGRHAAFYVWSSLPSQGNHAACFLEVEGGPYKTDEIEPEKGYGMRDNVFVRVQMPCNSGIADLVIRMMHVTRFFMRQLDTSLCWESDTQDTCA